MARSATTGSPWSDTENDAIVADYFAMLAAELAGKPYVKAHHNAAIATATGRSRGSVERKYMNISAVLMALGLPRIRGYAPNANAQVDALAAAIERYLEGHPDILEIVPDARSEDTSIDPFVAPPERTVKPLPGPVQRLARKFDPVARDARNRSLGKQGEAFVFELEQRRLHASGRQDLAEQVIWVSDRDGDGAGYDILSFDPAEGREKLIEVKTTNGGIQTPFFITRNEVGLSAERPEAFRLYRVFDFATLPRLFELRPPLEKAVQLEPQTWRAAFTQ